MENRITCPDLDTFCAVVAQLTQRGLAFSANASSLVIDVMGY